MCRNGKCPWKLVNRSRRCLTLSTLKHDLVWRLFCCSWSESISPKTCGRNVISFCASIMMLVFLLYAVVCMVITRSHVCRKDWVHVPFVSSGLENPVFTCWVVRPRNNVALVLVVVCSHTKMVRRGRIRLVEHRVGFRIQEERIEHQKGDAASCSMEQKPCCCTSMVLLRNSSSLSP